MGKTAFKFLVDSLKIAILVKKKKREIICILLLTSHRMWVMTIWMRWWTKLLVPSISQCFWHSLGSDCKGRTQKMSYETPLGVLTRIWLVSYSHFLSYLKMPGNKLKRGNDDAFEETQKCNWHMKSLTLSSSKIETLPSFLDRSPRLLIQVLIV